MSIAGDALPLRPLSIGEIFDRAVTLYVRYFGLFTLIMLVVVFPLTILSYFATFGNTAYQQILDQATHPGRTATPSPVILANLVQVYTILFFVVVLQVLLMPFAYVATAAGVAALYRAQRPAWRECYAAAVRRWPAILGAELMTLIVLGAVVIAGSLVFGVTFGVGIFLVRGSTAGIVVFSIVLILLILVWLMSMALCAFALGFAYNAIAVEGAGLFAAMSLGFSRIFDRRELGRAALVVLALFAISLGMYIVLALLAALAEGVTHNLTLYELVTAPLSLITSTFTALLFAVYYFDVRVRREGLDMQSALERLE